MIPPEAAAVLAPAAGVLGATAVGLYLGVLLPRLGPERSPWKVLRNLEAFRAASGGSALWGAFLLVSTVALLLGLGALYVLTGRLTAW